MVGVDGCVLFWSRKRSQKEAHILWACRCARPDLVEIWLPAEPKLRPKGSVRPLVVSLYTVSGGKGYKFRNGVFARSIGDCLASQMALRTVLVGSHCHRFLMRFSY